MAWPILNDVPMRFSSALLLLVLTPALSVAQPVLSGASAPLTTSASTWILHSDHAVSADHTRTPTPLWATSDGRILAMIAFGGSHHGAPTLPQAPQIGSAADWQLIDVTNFVSGGLSLKIDRDAAAYARFGHGIVLAPLNPAAASFACASTPTFTLDRPCALAGSVAHRAALRVGAQLAAGDFDLDLGYGMAWLNTNPPAYTATAPAPAWDVFSSIGNENLPTLVVPGMPWADVSNAGISASARWHLDETQSLDLGAALSRLQFELPGNPLASSFNQAALSLGMHHGDFSGLIVGRLLAPADPLASGQRWTSIDLGISWRAPWRGVFSVGAQNLWSSGSPPLLTNPANADADPSQARVPYVQYHQDL